MAESLLGGHEPPAQAAARNGSSDRTFGVVFAIVLAAIGLWPAAFGASPRWGVCAAAAIVAGFAALRPRTLAPLNRLWTRFGLLLHRLVSPCVLAVVFFLAVTPIGVVMRLLGHDPLALRRDRGAKGSWTKRQPPAGRHSSMTQQF